MSFSEERLEDGVVSLQMQGGNEFSTTVVSVNGGFEQRNSNWTQARGQWQVGMRTVSPDEFYAFKSFFMARKGKWQGFRIKDWMDYKDDGAGLLGTTGLASYAIKVYQLYKNYPSGVETYQRKISKPVSGQIEVFVDSVQFPVGAGEGNVSIDYATGLVTFNDYSRNVNGATNAANCEISTTLAHGLTTGFKIYLQNLAGLTQLNGAWYTATVTGANTFTIGVDTRVGLITNITQATQAVVTTSNVHGYQIGDFVYLDQVAGMTEVNGNTYEVVAVGSNSLTLNVNSTGFTAYTSGGKLRKSTQTQFFGVYTSGGQAVRNLQDGQTIGWTGEFDVPVRFDTDKFEAQLEAVIHPVNSITRNSESYVRLGNFPVVEIRV